MKILIAEDSDTARTLVVSYAERLGHQVVAVANGKEALDALKDNQFDLALIDIEMPVMNGVEFLQKVRADEILISVFIISNHVSKYVDECLKLGAIGFGQKSELKSLLPMILAG